MTNTIGRFANEETNANFGSVYLQATVGSINNFQNLFPINDTILGKAFNDYIQGGGGNDEPSGNAGTCAFTNVAGELRYVQSNGVTLIQGDTNGDGVADFAIVLTGTISLVAGDFTL